MTGSLQLGPYILLIISCDLFIVAWNTKTLVLKLSEFNTETVTISGFQKSLAIHLDWNKQQQNNCLFLPYHSLTYQLTLLKALDMSTHVPNCAVAGVASRFIFADATSP